MERNGRWVLRKVLLGGASLLLVSSGCSGPQTGTWRGSAEVQRADKLTSAIWTVQLHCGTDREGGEGCRVDLQPPGESMQQLVACSFVRAQRKAELTVDLGRPACDGPQAERLHLVGTVGEGVWFGEVQRSGNAVGRFRAYLDRP